MNIIEYQSRDLLCRSLADELASNLKNALLTKETAVLVVPGGTTPGPIFDALCDIDLDWARVHILLSDERWVPPEHARSNAALLARRLLMGRAAEARFTPFYMEHETPQSAAHKLAASFAEDLPISVLLLGMGADMHTASLFPGAENLAAQLAADAPVLVPVSVTGQEPRISFSAQALNSSAHKHLVIFGDDKRAALETAKTAPPIQAPIAAVMDSMSIHWAP